ncbi:MAG: thioredoxin fold domain-containing protein [Chromatiales bacterium]|nr:thioredoxin fold domain-containing protein [Chromatiales bacterium]
MKTTRLLTFLALLAWLAPALATETPRDPYQHFFQDTFGDFQEELEMARDEGKKGVLIFFEMDECPFCHRMKQYVLNQPAVQDYYRENFRIFAVDIEGDIEITDFQGNLTKQKDFAFKQNQVRATPVFAFFDLEGNRVARYTGAPSGVEEFMWLGEFVADGHYNDTTFIKYKRDRRAEARAQ